jgi:hypothetical protein
MTCEDVLDFFGACLPAVARRNPRIVQVGLCLLMWAYVARPLLNFYDF